MILNTDKDNKIGVIFEIEADETYFSMKEFSLFKDEEEFILKDGS